jgi:hypothetical protein
VCPFHPDFVKEPGASTLPETAIAKINAARDKVLAGISQKKTYVFAGGAGMKRKAEDGGGAAGGGKAGAPVSMTSSMRYRLMDGSNTVGVPPTRDFIRILEGRLSEEGARDIYRDLWDMCDRPGAASLGEGKMDIKKLRHGVVNRLYRSWEEINREIGRLNETAKIVLGPTHAKKASAFCKAFREWHRVSETNTLKRAGAGIEALATTRATVVIEGLAEEILRAGYDAEQGRVHK